MEACKYEDEQAARLEAKLAIQEEKEAAAAALDAKRKAKLAGLKR